MDFELVRRMMSKLCCSSSGPYRPAAFVPRRAAAVRRRMRDALRQHVIRLGRKVYERGPGRFVRWLLKDETSPG